MDFFVLVITSSPHVLISSFLVAPISSCIVSIPSLLKLPNSYSTLFLVLFYFSLFHSKFCSKLYLIVFYALAIPSTLRVKKCTDG